MILHFKVSGLELQSCSCFHPLLPHFLSNLHVSSSAVLVRQQMRKAPLASASCEGCRGELPCLHFISNVAVSTPLPIWLCVVLPTILPSDGRQLCLQICTFFTDFFFFFLDLNVCF